HSGYGLHLMTVGRVPECIAALERAQELDPLSPSPAADIAWAHFRAGRMDRALAACHHALEVDPNYLWASLYLAELHVLEGNYGKAVAPAREARREAPEGPKAPAVLGYVYAQGRGAGGARGALAEVGGLGRRRFVAPCLRAMVFGGLGEADPAFPWLRVA